MTGQGILAANLAALLETETKRNGGVRDAEGDFKSQFRLIPSLLRWTLAQKGWLSFYDHSDMVSPFLLQFLRQFLPKPLVSSLPVNHVLVSSTLAVILPCSLKSLRPSFCAFYLTPSFDQMDWRWATAHILWVPVVCTEVFCRFLTLTSYLWTWLKWHLGLLAWLTQP